MIEHKYQHKDYEGFDAGHRSVVRNNSISRDARLLFVIINSFSATREGCYIGNGRLAMYMDCDPRSIRNWIAELRDAGAIKIHILSENRRRIEICASVENGENEEENNPGTEIPTPRNARSNPQEQAFHIGNGTKGFDQRIASSDAAPPCFKREQPRQKESLPKDCLRALKDAGIDQDNIQRVAEHFGLMKILADHPKTVSLPRRCVAAARAFENEDDWREAEKLIPTAILAIKNDQYLPGVEAWLEGRHWKKQNCKSNPSPGSYVSPIIKSFLENATDQQKTRFYEKKPHWMQYFHNSNCNAFQLAQKIQADIDGDWV